MQNWRHERGSRRRHPAARSADRRRASRAGRRQPRSSSSSGCARLAVAERRDGNDPDRRADRRARPAPTLDRQLHLIRAFGWLSLLANTAEDLHHERRRRYHRDAGSGSQDGSTRRHASSACSPAASPPTTIADHSRESVVSPVITAHPTEVRRKTVLDHVDAVADLLAAPRRRRRERQRAGRDRRRSCGWRC